LIKSRKFYKNSYITEHQVKVFKTLKKAKNISDAARELGISPTTIYTIRRDMEAAIERAIRTLEVAQELGLLDEDRLAGLMGD